MEENLPDEPPGSSQKAQSKAVLDPEHPLLQKFQQALKEHYLGQIARLKDEIFEYETETKKKSAEKDLLGIQTYEAQQVVCKQQKVLENLVTTAQTATAAREELENKLKLDKTQYKEAQQVLVKEEKKNMELLNEISAVNLLISQLSQWENKIESNISINQRIAEKTRKDNVKLTEEKKMQDAYIYKLMNIIWKLETEISTLDIQIQLKQTEKSELEQTITLGNTNIEALQAEYRCLLHSWNSVIVAISNRDKLLDCLKNEDSKIHEKIKSVKCEVEQMKKLTRKEMIQHERSTMNKARIELDICNCQKQTDDEIARYNALENHICDLQAIIQQTQIDIDEAVALIHNKQGGLVLIQKDYDKIMNRRNQLEQQLLDNLGDQKYTNKAAAGLLKTLSSLKAMRRDTEIRLLDAENKRCFLATEIEAQKYLNDESKSLLEDAISQKQELMKHADALTADIEKNQLLFRKREGQVTVLNSKLEKILEKSGSTILASPEELKIIALEKQIIESQDKIKNLQTFWLREQKNLLNVSKDRQEQILKVNLLKKQVLILEQKNLKITNELEQYKKQEAKILHNISNLQNKALVLCDKLFKKRDQKQHLDDKNYYLQSQFDGKLLDCDLERLRIEQEILDIEEDKVNLSKELIEVNREALEWEKKIQLAKETRNNMKEERSTGGEIDNMKQEIQRMNVIYAQLKRAQDRLIKDLDQCVSRREAIYTVSEARQRKLPEDRTRINYSRKMDDIRNKLKQLDGESKEVGNKIEELERDKEQVLKDIDGAQKTIEFYHDYSSKLDEEIERAKSDRQLKFELLLLVQKKVKMLNEIIVGKVPFTVFKREDLLVLEYNRQSELNNKIGEIIEKLTMDFPMYSHQFGRMYNTLKVHVLTLGTSIGSV